MAERPSRRETLQTDGRFWNFALGATAQPAELKRAER